MYSRRGIIIVFAVNSGCHWEMFYPWISGKSFFSTAERQNITRIAGRGVVEMSSSMSKDWILGLSLQPPSLAR